VRSLHFQNNDFYKQTEIIRAARLETLYCNFKLLMSVASEFKKLFESAIFKHFRPPSLMIFNE